MPPSEKCRDRQVNSSTVPHLEAAVTDLKRQRETTHKLVKSLLERLSPPQAENAKVPVHRSDQTPITIPAPSSSSPFAHSAPFISSNLVPVDRFALSASFPTSALRSVGSENDSENSEDFEGPQDFEDSNDFHHPTPSTSQKESPASPTL